MTGERTGWAIEPRNKHFEVPTLFEYAEGNIAGGVMREPSVDLARSENQGMCGISMCENREIPRLSVVPDQDADREGKAEASSPR